MIIYNSSLKIQTIYLNKNTPWKLSRHLPGNRLRLIGSTLRSRSSEEKSRILRALETELWPRFADGKLVNNIHAIFPIAEVEKAHAVLRRNENIGKVLLTF